MSTYEKIDKIRKEKGITLAFLNEKIGGYRGKLTEVKNGKTSLTETEISIIADVLEVSTDYLLGNTDDPRSLGEQKEKTDSPKGTGLSPAKQEAWEFIQNMDDETLYRFVAAAKAMLGE